MNKTIIVIIFIVMGIGGLMWWGKSAQRPATSSSTKIDTGAKNALIASETLYDFGTISMKNGNVTKEFIVTNPTDKDIVIPSLVTSCMCTKAFIVEPDGTTKGPFGMPGMGSVPPADEIIKVGENRIIKVVYDPNAHGPAGVGQINRFISLTDLSGNTLKLEIKALVTP